MNERLIRFAVIIICLIAVLGNKSSTQAHEIVGMSILDTITRPQTQMVNIAAISTGGNHACVLTSVGGVMCWGGNYYGQLGDGTTASARSMPMDVVGLSSGIIAVAAGADHTCAVTLSGGVKCWGRNLSGQVGDGTTNDRRTPVDVIGLSSNVMTVTAAADHTCALMTTGSVKCWGKNEFGKLGDGTTDDRLTPADVVGLNTGATAVTAGWNHTCALTSVGGIKCWGRNSHGKLGDGTTDDRLTPVDVVGLHTGAIAITAGEGHTCVLLSTGTAKCWGWNIYGQVGDSTTNDRFTPVDVVGLNSSVATITTLADHTCALTLGGDAKCWGWNFYGQLGDDTTNDRSAPVDVVGLGAGVAAVALGSFHTCALMSNGGIKCWGENFHRQLGDGTTNHSSTPVDVVLESSNDSALQPIDETIYANGPVYPGGTVGISLKVQNTTEQTIDSGQVSVWVSTIENGEPINNNLISQRSIATINGGEASEEGTLFAQVPLSLNAGTYYLVMDVQNTSVAASSVDSVHTPATHRRSIQFTAENCATGSLFCDVQSDETFYNEIMEVYGNGIMEPCSADQVTGRVGFCPEAWIYREELAEPLLKLYHNDSAYETTTTYRGTFVDVSSSNEHANAIQELFDLGLTTGCAGTAGVDLKFCPAPRSMDGVGYTTRTHMALFLARALQWDLSTPAQGIFADVTGDSPNARAIEQMWYHGFTTGPSSCSKSNYTSANGRIYCPDDYVTRGHIAAFLARAFGYVGTTPPQFSITGKVTNRNNQGVGAVTITLVHNPKESPVSSITQNDGSFTFSEIPAGPYLLHLKKDGYSFSTGDAGTNPYFPDVLTDNVTGLDFRGGRKDDLTIINLTVCYYSSVDEGNRQNYTTAFQYFADTVYDMTNGAHKIGTVTMLQNCTEGSIPTADIIWGNQGQPMAFGSGYGHDSKYLFFYDDAYWKGTEHFHIPHGKRLDCAGQTLAHEVGHYVYGLLDEYWGDNSGVQKSIMSRQLGNCLKNIYWRNFSTSNNHQASPENGQHNVYEASAWETLNRPSTADPKNGQFAGFEGGAEVILDRIYFPALKTVAPDPGNDPTVEIPGQENEARSALNVNWQQLNNNTTHRAALFEEQPLYNASVEIIGETMVDYPKPVVILANATQVYPITGINVQSIIRYPDASESIITLKDNGISPDTTANDGLYTAFMPYSMDGTYVIRARFVNTTTTTARFTTSAYIHEPDSEKMILDEIISPFELFATTTVDVNDYRSDDHGNTTTQATNLSLDNLDYPGKIDNAGDIDIFRITTSASGEYVVRLFNFAFGMEATVSLLAENGATLQEYEFIPTINGYFHKKFTIPTSKTVYISVAHRNENASEGLYYISVGPSLSTSVELQEKPTDLLPSTQTIYLPLIAR